MFGGLENAVLKKVYTNKEGRKYLTFGDIDAIAEVDVQTNNCDLQEGYRGAVRFNGVELRAYNRDISIDAASVVAIPSPDQKPEKPDKK